MRLRTAGVTFLIQYTCTVSNRCLGLETISAGVKRAVEKLCLTLIEHTQLRLESLAATIQI